MAEHFIKPVADATKPVQDAEVERTFSNHFHAVAIDDPRAFECIGGVISHVFFAQNIEKTAFLSADFLQVKIIRPARLRSKKIAVS